MEKSALRSQIRQRRALRSALEQDAAALAIAERAIDLIPEGSRDVTSYLALPGEPGTAPLNSALLESGRHVWLPRITGAQLEWLRFEVGSALITGPMGISEPVGEGRNSPEFVDVMLMPALAADMAGRRLGQGRGYFDRTLESLPPYADGGPLLVALLHDGEVIDTVPTEPHDRRIDVIITPTRTLRCATRA